MPRILSAISCLVALTVVIGCTGDTEISPACPNPEVSLGSWTTMIVGGRHVVVDTLYINGGYYESAATLPRAKVYGGMPEYSFSFDTLHPGVKEYFDVLTNGSDENLAVQFTWPPGGGISRRFSRESTGMKGGVTGDLLPDLQGTQVTRVMYHVLGLYLDSPGEDPNNDGIWTDCIITVNVEFWGHLRE